MTFPVYIPTKARADLIGKTLPSWTADEWVEVNLVVEPQDEAAYAATLERLDLEMDVSLRVLAENDKGIGYARNGCIDFAIGDGAEGFIMSDDDVSVEPGIHRLARFMEEKVEAAGVGFAHRINLHWGGHERDTGVHPVNGGTALNCIGLSAWTLEQEGIRYDERIRPYQDKDLLLQLLRAGYGPWYLHSGAFGKMVGQRYQSGGNAAHDAVSALTRNEREVAMYELLCDKWGERYFSMRKASRAMREQGVEKIVAWKWKRIYEDLNPRAARILYGK